MMRTFFHFWYIAPKTKHVRGQAGANWLWCNAIESRISHGVEKLLRW